MSDSPCSSLLVRVGSSDNANFAPIVSALSNVVNKDATHSITGFKLKDFMTVNMGKFYRYQGSLTTPTCDESVTWTVFAEPLSMSESQLATFRTLYEDTTTTKQMVNNYRPPLALNGRSVHLYTSNAPRLPLGISLAIFPLAALFIIV
uniref:carbonic anhydrase n=1 Tax=Magallana gigas TaxID=29159 RepID=A0A8W8N0U2_MAGGI